MDLWQNYYLIASLPSLKYIVLDTLIMSQPFINPAALINEIKFVHLKIDGVNKKNCVLGISSMHWIKKTIQ